MTEYSTLINCSQTLRNSHVTTNEKSLELIAKHRKYLEK